MKYLYGKLTERKLIVSDQVDTLHIYEIKNNELFFVKEMKFNFRKDDYFRNFEYLESEDTLIIGQKKGVIQFIDLTSEKVISEVQLPLSDDYYLDWNLDILKLSNDNKWLAVGQTWYTAYPLNLSTLKSIEISIPAQPLEIKYSFDNNYVSLIHGEQGGQGLIIYHQTEDGNWIEVYEDWAILAFEFAKNQNAIYHFGLEDNIGILKKISLADNNTLEWKTFLSLADLGNESIYAYGFGINDLTLINNCLEFSINNKTIVLNEKNGKVLKNYNNNNRTKQTLYNSKIKIRLTEDKIISEII